MEIEAPTLTIFGNRVAEFLWNPETLLKFRIADEGQPSRDSQSERVAFTHSEDLRKIDLLKSRNISTINFILFKRVLIFFFNLIFDCN